MCVESLGAGIASRGEPACDGVLGQEIGIGVASCCSLLWTLGYLGGEG